MMSAGQDDLSSQFEWMGKNKEKGKKEEEPAPQEPPEKDPMPTTLDFVFRNYYYEVIKIDIGEGYKIMRENVKSSWKDSQSALAVVKVPLPCGMVLSKLDDETGRISGVIEVTELVEGGNAEKAGIKVGDAFRACNAVV